MLSTSYAWNGRLTSHPHRLARRLATGAMLALATTALAAPVMAQTLATVNGKPLTEADLRLAEAELGPELAQLPLPERRRILLEYLIESEIYADAAQSTKLGSGPDFEARVHYWRRRALRDLYFDKVVKASVTEADARKFYDDQVKAIQDQAKTQKPEDEIKASHILIKDETKAKEVASKLAKGGDFATLAKEFSEDPGSKDNGGDLGYFSKGQMVPEFETAAFALEKGKISDLVKSSFGYHIIKLVDRRPKQAPPPPPFDSLKARILASLQQKKAQALGGELRAAVKIDYLDPDIKAAVEKENAAKAAAPQAPLKKK